MSARWGPADDALLERESRRMSSEWDEHVAQAVGLTRPVGDMDAGWSQPRMTVTEWAVVVLACLVLAMWAALLIWALAWSVQHIPGVLVGATIMGGAGLIVAMLRGAR